MRAMIEEWSKAVRKWGSAQAGRFRAKALSFYRSHPKWKLALMGAGSVFALGATAVLGIALLVYTQVLGPLPGYPELRAIRNHNASEVYAADGVLLGRYYIENRVNADFEEISPELINALVATEDARFFEHSGIDLRAAGRVLVKSVLLMDESSGGGSTLSQQLAKNLYPRQSYRMLSMVVNKMREMIIARRLEKTYAKEELLRLYLNTVSFGESIFGVKVAAQRFFNKSPKDLTIEEGAVLVGMLKATTYYNPVRHPERAVKRRNIVLGQMVRYGYLEAAVKDSLAGLPLETRYVREGHNQGLATYFREHLRHEVERLLEGKTKPDGTAYNLYTDGLKIYTTLDAKLQQYAEEAVSEEMAKVQARFYEDWKKGVPWGRNEVLQRAVEASERYQRLAAAGKSQEEIAAVFSKPVPMTVFSWEGGEEEREMSPLDSIKYYLTILNAGFLAADPSTGLVKAWVGGVSHKYFQYDHIFARRQVGSTFKPIVFATALQSGMLPCEYTPNRQVSYASYDNWSPRNADGAYEGVYSMAGALSNSVNTVTVEIMMRTGIDSVRQMARAMGVSSAIPAVPSISLGAVEASLFDMVKVYGTFANRGRRPELHYLDRIATADGEVLLEMGRPEPRRFPVVLPEGQADMMIKMLEQVVDSGTARKLRYEYGLYNEVAGKTGTTQQQSDGWFMGFNPKLVAGAWVGAELPQVHFRTLYRGQGSSTALPIFGNFMRRVYRDKSFKEIRYARFSEPADSIAALMQCPPYLDEMPVLAAYEDGYYYFEDNRSLLGRLLEQPYRDAQGRIVQVPPRRAGESDEDYLGRVRAYQEQLEAREGRKEKRKAFWSKLLFNKDKAEEGTEQEEPPTTGYRYFDRKEGGN
ncbi:transglycosylase domain-containing protein [Phaeodactylibacter luteus]|uniref:Penicillin-binding protein n=1 Tax=Phaeodactylibacter luteus TaxID=1564516 RepID=A0A5C6RPS7_9BACT|nr:transglycosylase domain-containing protein [Phaeodactylibacter luteus]TXB64137.1 penicillin-binding protein [Phaeodactylibacter luteus]